MNRSAGSVVYAATMHRLLTTVAVITLLALTACNTANRRLREVSATHLPDPKTQAQIKKGIIEPGYTPEMVYLALGKPSEPAAGLADATTNGCCFLACSAARKVEPRPPGALLVECPSKLSRPEVATLPGKVQIK